MGGLGGILSGVMGGASAGGQMGGGWGALFGGLLGGGAASAASDAQGPGGAPPPTQMWAQNPSAVYGQYGSQRVDPRTGAVSSYFNQYNPGLMGNELNTQAMSNNFYGMGNGGTISAIDRQIADLESQLKNNNGTNGRVSLDDPKYGNLKDFLDPGTNKPINISDPAKLFKMATGYSEENTRHGDMGYRALLDPMSGLRDKNPLSGSTWSDAASRLKGDIQNETIRTPSGEPIDPQAARLYQNFMTETGGNYGGTGAMGFGKWLKDTMKRNIEPLYAKYSDDVVKNGGNLEAASQQSRDIQQQIAGLKQARVQYGGETNPDGSPKEATPGKFKDPFERFQNDLGATWAGNMDNRNERTDQWGQVTDDRIDKTLNGDPMEEFQRYLGSQATPEGRQKAIDEFKAKMGATLGGGLSGNYDRINAPELNTDAAGAAEGAANFRAGREMLGQQAQLRNRLGDRGMSAMGELAAFGAGQGLIGAEAQNHATALDQWNNVIAQNYGMKADANRQNNAGFFQDRDQQLRARQQGLEANATLNGMNNNLFSQGLQQTGMSEQMRDNWFRQAQAALQTQNQMRSEDRAWNVQDYGFKRGENDALYGRANDTYGRLQGANQQNFMNRLGLSQQGMAENAANQQVAQWNTNNQNQVNAANSGNANAFAMFNAQSNANAGNANSAGWMNALGSVGRMAGNNAGSRTGGSGQVANPWGNNQTQTPSHNTGGYGLYGDTTDPDGGGYGID